MKFLLWLIPAEIERAGGRLLCALGWHSWSRYTLHWGTRRVWMKECKRLDCRAGGVDE